MNTLNRIFIEFGLTVVESENLITLLSKMSIPKLELDHYNTELESGIPFEGGMFLNEALVGLLIALPHYDSK